MRATCGSAIVRAVGAIDAGEDRLQAVIIFLRDRIELVIVAAGAVDGQADEGDIVRRHHVVAIEERAIVLVDRALAQFDMADEVPRPGGDEAVATMPSRSSG